MTEAVRVVRAAYDERTITVYQAYPAEIARPALVAGTFVPPFGTGRMTWIKPSFLWMMYRCGWGEKADQEHVLAVRITREGFAWALAHASLSHFDAAVHTDRATWEASRDRSPVRVQWDPDRSVTLDRLDRRAVQVGLSGEAVRRYVGGWIEGIVDVTPLARAVRDLVRRGALDEARAQLPEERPYPLPSAIRERLGADG
jgi:hypothetical protein